jgi:serine/threonine-protein kinase
MASSPSEPASGIRRRPDALAETLPTGPSIAPAVRDAQIEAGSPIGEYVVEAPIGSGAFGDVYRGVHPLIGKQVAIKVLSLRYSVDPDIVSRFVEEARAVNRIGHSGIIDIFAFGRLNDGRQYYVMELLEGMTLLELLQSRGRLPLAEALSILDPIGRALDAAHAAGIAHRDLKPANIFLARDDGRWRPKLLDFGVAKLLDREATGSHRTETGVTVGTPAYMAPEQCIGKGVDHRADIYAFGVVAFEMLTGRLPFDADSAFALMAAHINEPPPDLRLLVPEVPEPVARAIGWLLAKKPEDRPANLAEALNVLSAAARGVDTGVLGVPAPARKRGKGVVGAVAAVVLLAGGAAWWWARSSSDAPVADVTPSEPSAPPVAVAPPPSVAPPSVAPAPVTAAPLPATVEVRVDDVPPDARILGPGGVELRHGPGPVRLDRGTSSRDLTVEAPGFKSRTVPIVPDRDQAVVVALDREPAPPPAPRPTPRSAPTGHDGGHRGLQDLEPWGN